MLGTTDKTRYVYAVHLIKVDSVLEMTEVYLFFCFCVVHLSCPDFDAEDGFVQDSVSDVLDLALKAKLSIEGIFDANWQPFVE